MSDDWLPSLDPKLPKYRALYQAILDDIEAGTLKVGQRLPTHRHLADALGITVGVVTKAYAMALREGLLQSRVGSGTFVGPQHNGYSPFPQEIRSSSSVMDLSVSIVPPNPRRADALGQAMAALSQDSERLYEGVQYQHAEGEVQARHAMSHLMKLCGMPVDPNDLMLTLGGQHGLALCCDVLLKADGHLAAAEIGYQGIVGLSRLKGLKLIPMPMNEGRIDVNAIESRARQSRIDALYVTPELHNPTGGTLNQWERERLVLLAEQFNFWIIEDVVHTTIGQDKPDFLFQLAPDRVITVFSTSKLLAGGLRVGAIRVPDTHRIPFALAMKSHSWMVPPMMGQIVSWWAERGESEKLLQWQNQEVIARQALAQRYLSRWIQHPPEPGCFFVWLRVEREHSASTLALKLMEFGIKVGIGAPFWIGHAAAPEAIRVCVSAARTRDELENALRKIAQVMSMQPEEFVTV